MSSRHMGENACLDTGVEECGLDVRYWQVDVDISEKSDEHGDGVHGVSLEVTEAGVAEEP